MNVLEEMIIDNVVEQLKSNRAFLLKYGIIKAGVGDEKHITPEIRLQLWKQFVNTTEPLVSSFTRSLGALFIRQEEATLNTINLNPPPKVKGGEGSGNFGHAGRPGEVGGSGSGGITSDSSLDRAQRAIRFYKPATQEVQHAGDMKQRELANLIEGEETGDNSPFDVIKGRNFIEVKTIVRGGNKITMHPESLRRKVSYARKFKGKSFTVVFDNRFGKVYYRKGIGSFRISNMKETSLPELKELFL